MKERAATGNGAVTRVAVLTGRPDLPVCRELEAAGARQGVAVDVLDALSLVGRAWPPEVLGGAGPWPEPRAPDVRVRDFGALRAFLAAEDARRAVHLSPEGLS